MKNSSKSFQTRKYQRKLDTSILRHSVNNWIVFINYLLIDTFTLLERRVTIAARMYAAYVHVLWSSIIRSISMLCFLHAFLAPHLTTISIQQEYEEKPIHSIIYMNLPWRVAIKKKYL